MFPAGCVILYPDKGSMARNIAFFARLFFFIGNRQNCQLLKSSGKGKQEHRCRNIKQAVYRRYPRGICRLAHKRKMKRCIAQVKCDQKNSGSDYIKIQMNCRRSSGIFPRSDTGQNRCHAGTYILPHYNGNRRIISDSSRGAQRLSMPMEADEL